MDYRMVLVPLAVLLCFTFQAGAQSNWLGEDPQIADIHHTAEYLAKTGGSSGNSAKTTPAPEAAPAKADLSGDWSLELKVDTSVKNGAVVIGKAGEGPAETKSVNLGLRQIGEVVFGWGTMTTGDSSVVVASSGSVSEDKLSLDLISPEEGDFYRLDLTISEETVSGSYDGYNYGGETWFGSASGVHI